MIGVSLKGPADNREKRMADDCQAREAQSHGGSQQQVLVIEPPVFFTFHEDRVSQRFDLLKAWESPLPLDEFLTTQAHAVQALLSSGRDSISGDVLNALPSLKLIVTPSTGFNHIDLQECRRRGISIAYPGTMYADDVADAAVGLLIDVLRKISAADRYVRNGFWTSKGDFVLGSKLSGKRVGIVGLGRIGLEVAKRLESFRCKILYNSRSNKSSVSYPYYSNVRQLAADSDALIICCGLTDQTRHLINKEVMLALGKGGVIINVGRGPIIDEEEMVRCLMRGDIGGAGLDVFEKEPHVPNELLGLDNVVLSPHCAVHTAETEWAVSELVIRNLEAFFSKKPLLSPVRLE